MQQAVGRLSQVQAQSNMQLSDDSRQNAQNNTIALSSDQTHVNQAYDTYQLAAIKRGYFFHICVHLIIFIVLSIHLITNRDQMTGMQANFFDLWLYLIINIVVIFLQMVLIIILTRVVTIGNQPQLDRINQTSQIMTNCCLAIWGLHLIYHQKWQEVFGEKEFRFEEHWKFTRVLATIVIWVRVMVLGCAFSIIAILTICLAFCCCMDRFNTSNDANSSQNSTDDLQHQKRLKGVKEYIQKNTRQVDTQDKEGTCAICLEDFKTSAEKPIAQLNCSNKHIFHKECLVTWVNTRDICPLCRESIPFT